MNLKAPTVISIVVAMVTITATSLLAFGGAWNRLAVVEGRVAEMDQMRLTIRDLQNQANAQKDAHDATRRELTETKKLLGSATGLLFEMCLSDERQKRTGTPCKLVQP